MTTLATDVDRVAATTDDHPASASLLRRAVFAYAWSDLCHRRGVSALCWFACAVAAVLPWQLGAVAAAIADSRGRRLAAEEPTAVRVRVADAADARTHFTAARLRELRALPWVAGGGALVEVQVVASLGAGRERLVPAEGDVRPTPAPPEAMLWGVGRAAGGEVLLTHALLEALGGRLDAAGPTPGRLRARVSRTVGGINQTHEVELYIVGVLRRQQDADRIDVDVDVAQALDRWCHGDDVPGWPRARAVAEAVVGFDCADIEFGGAHREAVAAELRALGLSASAREPVPDAKVERVRVRRKSGCIAPAARVALETLKPAVRSVRPLCLVEAELADGTAVSLEASDTKLAQCELLAGNLPTRPHELAWPDAAEPRLDIGERVELRVRAADGASCTLGFIVCACVAGAAAVATLSDLAQVQAWQRGELEFVASTRSFTAPPPRPRSAGWLRATLYARGLEDVAPLVECLRRDYGYETRDQLEAFAAVQWFGRALAVLVACIVGGTLLLAVLMTLGMNTQKLQANVFEIGLLRALAVPDRRILRIYATQGLFLGGAALAVATGLQACCAPSLASALAGAFGLELGEAAAIGAFGPWQLVVAVVGLCLGCGVLGTTLPAWWMCRRLSLVDALRR